MNWQPIGNYIVADYTMGDDVLFAWKESRGWRQPDGWVYGVGHGSNYEPGSPLQFIVGEWDVQPLFFARIEPPEDLT